MGEEREAKCLVCGEFVSDPRTITPQSMWTRKGRWLARHVPFEGEDQDDPRCVDVIFDGITFTGQLGQDDVRRVGPAAYEAWLAGRRSAHVEVLKKPPPPPSTWWEHVLRDDNGEG